MLSFSFSEDQEMFRRTVRDFSQKEIAPALKGLPEMSGDSRALRIQQRNAL